MRTLCQFILAVVTVSTLHAQTLSLGNDTVQVTGYADAYEIIGYGTLFNNSPDTVNATWLRVVNDIPDDWEGSLVCDNNACYTPNTSAAPPSVPFRIPGSGQSNFDVHFKASDVAGNGTVVMKAWVIGDSANTVVTGVYKVTAQHPVGVEDKVQNENLLVYPNPAKDYVMIRNLPLNEVSTVEVYNLLGRKLLAFSQPPMATEVAHKFDLTSLAKGIYMIRVFDGDMNVIFTKSLSKE